MKSPDLPPQTASISDSAYPLSAVECEGDSITHGVGSLTPWPALLQTALGRKFNNRGVVGLTSTQILAVFQALPSTVAHYPTIIEAGRNDVTLGTTDNNVILANIASIVSALTSASNTKFLVFSVLKGGQSPTWTDTPTTWAQIDALNASLASTYAGKYLDINPLLFDVDGVTPIHRTDGLHPDQTGNQLIANAVQAYILANWTPPADIISAPAVPALLQNVLQAAIGGTVPGGILMSDTAGDDQLVQVPTLKYNGSSPVSTTSYIVDSTGLSVGTGMPALTLSATSQWTPWVLATATATNGTGKPPSQIVSLADNLPDGRNRQDTSRASFAAVRSLSHLWDGSSTYSNQLYLASVISPDGSKVTNGLALVYNETTQAIGATFEASTFSLADESANQYFLATHNNAEGTLTAQFQIGATGVWTLTSNTTSDTLSIGRGTLQTVFIVNGGTAANQNPSLKFARNSTTYFSMTLDNAQNLTIANRHGPVAYVRDFDVLGTGQYFEFATYPVFPTLADASAPAGAIWWSSDNANVLKCKAPDGTAKTITLA